MSSLGDELRAGSPPGPTAVAFGVFDGVHLGHRHIIDLLRSSAAERGLTAVVVTIANHPLSVLRPEIPVVVLTSLHERMELLRATGVAHVIPITFTRDVSLLTPEEFMRQMCDCLRLRHFVVGPDFALGHGRAGTIPVLAALGADLGYTVQAASTFEVAGAQVRSSAVRKAVSAGDLDTAASILGRPFSLDGPVVEGEGRGGGLLGFPTANLGVGPLQALPADGIYATWLSVEGERYAAATSVGIKPMFHADGPRVVESFVLDFDGDLYEKHARLEFIARLRGQERFGSVDALIDQIQRDVEQTRTVLGPAPGRAHRGEA